MKRLWFILVLACAANLSLAQVASHVTWAYGAKRTSWTEAVIMLKATIDDGWHIYSANTGKQDPTKTNVSFETSKEYTPVGNIVQPKPISKYFSGAKMTLSYFERLVMLQQKVKLKGRKGIIKGTIDYIVCNDHTCLPPATVKFAVPVAI